MPHDKPFWSPLIPTPLVRVDRVSLDTFVGNLTGVLSQIVLDTPDYRLVTVLPVERRNYDDRDTVVYDVVLLRRDYA